MSIKKNNEFLEHLFTNIIKKPMISEYYEQHQYQHQYRHSMTIGCPITHLGKCRYICHNCNNTKYVVIPPHSGIVDSYKYSNSIIRYGCPWFRFRKNSTGDNLRKVMYSQNSWFELITNPICDSCKVASNWKRKNWSRYVERAISGGVNEKKELRKIYNKKEERLTIRKLLTFFNCNTIASTIMRDSLVRVIDYSYEW